MPGLTRHLTNAFPVIAGRASALCERASFFSDLPSALRKRPSAFRKQASSSSVLASPFRKLPSTFRKYASCSSELPSASRKYASASRKYASASSNQASASRKLLSAFMKYASCASDLASASSNPAITSRDLRSLRRIPRPHGSVIRGSLTTSRSQENWSRTQIRTSAKRFTPSSSPDPVEHRTHR